MVEMLNCASIKDEVHGRVAVLTTMQTLVQYSFSKNTSVSRPKRFQKTLSKRPPEPICGHRSEIAIQCEKGTKRLKGWGARST
jgi:hypothetical protein